MRVRTIPFTPALVLLAFLCLPSTIDAQAASNPAPASPPSLRWYNAFDGAIEGKGWIETAKPTDRLPVLAETIVRPPVWELAHCSSGIYVCFDTDAHEITARWTLDQPMRSIEHMPATGIAGLDLYARDKGTWRWVGLARPKNKLQNEERILAGIPPGMHEYLMYLPLYSGVKSLQIGVNADASITPGVPSNGFGDGKPLVFYGTSITQGASASRPGMAYPAILGRRLNRTAINLGFASNGTMDLELAELMGEIDAAAYVVDCVPNMTMEMVRDRSVPFVALLRERRPDVPIVIVECIDQQNAWFLPGIQEGIVARNDALRSAFETMEHRGFNRLFYVEGSRLLGEATDTAVDGIHPSDLGNTLIANALQPVLVHALTETKASDSNVEEEFAP